MVNHSEPAKLANELADIAATTREPETARRLMVLVEALLTDAGLNRMAGEGRAGESASHPGTNHR